MPLDPNPLTIDDINFLLHLIDYGPLTYDQLILWAYTQHFATNTPEWLIKLSEVNCLEQASILLKDDFKVDGDIEIDLEVGELAFFYADNGIELQSFVSELYRVVCWPNQAHPLKESIAMADELFECHCHCQTKIEQLLLLPLEPYHLAYKLRVQKLLGFNFI
ncbi:hypothetical protein [Celerinatantimonas sp. MCCC 1A17872]|uniref:hypothetical protein n=1 Tax=Celerinatantimonas sp. MCCC 1A17872 TaxID=3177514 RepID=UPI0038C345BB